jgi:holo-[acyl-carrier protein] synthase
LSPDRAGSLAALEVGIVSTSRFRRAVERRGQRLLRRIFTEQELAYAGRRRDGTASLAARFAAKCAGRRALARLGGPLPGLRELEVARRASGEPLLVAHSLGMEQGRAPRLLLSLTHDADFAAATVWVEEGA